MWFEPEGSIYAGRLHTDEHRVDDNDSQLEKLALHLWFDVWESHMLTRSLCALSLGKRILGCNHRSAAQHDQSFVTATVLEFFLGMNAEQSSPLSPSNVCAECRGYDVRECLESGERKEEGSHNRTEWS